MRTLRSRQKAFTIIELLIAVVIVGVLVAVAFPTYQQSIRKGRRADAMAGLASIQQAQERWRSNHAEYGNLNSPPDAGTLPNVPTSNSNYAFSVSGPSATSYTATATARGSQTADRDCQVMAVEMDRGRLRYGSGTSSPDWADPGRCWVR